MALMKKFISMLIILSLTIYAHAETKEYKYDKFILVTQNMNVEVISNGNILRNNELALKNETSCNDSIVLENNLETSIEETIQTVVIDTIENIVSNEINTEENELNQIIKDNSSSKEEYTNVNMNNNEVISTQTEEVNQYLNLQEFEITFYTSSKEENGSHNITASGEKLGNEMLLASNVYPFGTVIYLEGYGELIVKDRGGKEFNSYNRVDVYIPINKGESYSDYKKRALEYGRKIVKGKVIK